MSKGSSEIRSHLALSIRPVYSVKDVPGLYHPRTPLPLYPI